MTHDDGLEGERLLEEARQDAAKYLQVLPGSQVAIMLDYVLNVDLEQLLKDLESKDDVKMIVALNTIREGLAYIDRGNARMLSEIEQPDDDMPT